MLIFALAAAFFAIVLAFLVWAFVFRRDFRDAVLKSPGEASFLGFSVKGVVFVLLFAFLVAAIVFTLGKAPVDSDAPKGAIAVRFDVHFEPDEVNPGGKPFVVRAYLKTPNGNQPIRVVPEVNQGAVTVRFSVPDMQTPFFVTFETAKGIWMTDDYRVTETKAAARKQE